MQRQNFGFWTDQCPYRWSHRISSLILRFLGRLESYGNEHIPRQGGALLMANHVSFLDPIIIGTAANRELYYMARHDAFEIPVLGKLAKLHNAYPVRRGTADRAALRHTISLLKLGKAVLIFPEGTRSPNGTTLGRARHGASFIAYSAAVPTVPVFLRGADRLMPRNAKWIYPTQLSVTFGPPIDFTEVRKIADKREAYRRMGEKIMQSIAEVRDAQAAGTH